MAIECLSGTNSPAGQLAKPASKGTPEGSEERFEGLTLWAALCLHGVRCPSATFSFIPPVPSPTTAGGP
eukprot:11228293-Lingulodinium_polyedra.AAC.2